MYSTESFLSFLTTKRRFIIENFQLFQWIFPLNINGTLWRDYRWSQNEFSTESAWRKLFLILAVSNLPSEVLLVLRWSVPGERRHHLRPYQMIVGPREKMYAFSKILTMWPESAGDLYSLGRQWKCCWKLMRCHLMMMKLRNYRTYSYTDWHNWVDPYPNSKDPGGGSRSTFPLLWCELNLFENTISYNFENSLSNLKIIDSKICFPILFDVKEEWKWKIYFLI